MQLRELNFPIAIEFTDGIEGGLGSLRSKSSSCFEFIYDEEFLKGRFDDAVIYDSSGRYYKVVEIKLFDPPWWRLLLRRASGFFIFPDKAKGRFAKVDMQLHELGELPLAEFKELIRTKALENPDWWKRHSRKREIQSMMMNSSTFPEAISDIGVLEIPSKRREWQGISEKTVDLR